MTETTQLTAQQLNEMQAGLDRQKAELSITKIDAALEMWDTHDVADLVTTLSEIATSMPDGLARNQLENTLSILAGTEMILNSERNRNQRVLEPVVPTMPVMPPITSPAE